MDTRTAPLKQALRRMRGFPQPFIACFPLLLSDHDSPDLDVVRSAIHRSEYGVVILNAPSPPRNAGILPCSKCLHEYPVSSNTLGTITSGQTLLNNINKSTTVDEAVYQITQAFETTHSPLMKLEILDEEKRPRNDLILEVVRQAQASCPSASFIPFLFPEESAVRRAVDLDCIGVRLLAGEIGAGTGLLYKSTIASICSWCPLPVILEGGITTEAHVEACFSAGADYVLATSAFQDQPDPAALAYSFQRVAQQAILQRR